MNPQQVVRTGRTGIAYTATGIIAARSLGFLLGRAPHVGEKVSYVVSVGTATCGGSTIAAVTSMTKSNDEDIAVSLGMDCVLNFVALWLFP